jgi:putative ABC transport system substrate-binding protein
MKRRAFIAGLVSAAAWPMVAQGQQPRTPVIGFLFPFGLTTPVMRPYLAVFRHSLQEGGFVEGRNLTIEYRAADGHLDRLPSLVPGITVD